MYFFKFRIRFSAVNRTDCLISSRHLIVLSNYYIDLALTGHVKTGRTVTVFRLPDIWWDCLL